MSFEEFVVIIVLCFVMVFGILVMTRQSREEQCENSGHARHSQQWKACIKTLNEQK